MIQINMQISARTADDAQEIGEVVRRQFPELEEHIRRSTFNSNPFTARITQLANRV